MARSKLQMALQAYALRYPDEGDVVVRFRALLDEHPRCFHNDCWAGHITGSAWVLHPQGGRVLLTHHKKLGRWLQLGGHSDGDEDTWQVATREAVEESGLQVHRLDDAVFDLDIHDIPARKNDPQHAHFDVRFAFVAQSADFSVTDESHALAWVPVDALQEYTDEWSVLRMAQKMAVLPTI